MDSPELKNAKRMLTILKINEWMWLVFVAISAGASIYMLTQKDRDQALYFLILIFLSGFFYSFKRRQRKKHQKRVDEMQNK